MTREQRQDKTRQDRNNINVTYLFIKWGINRSPGISKKAGNVILLKTPNTATMPRIAEARTEEEVCLVSRMRSIKTRLQATARVSIELENVWVWKVQVT